MMSKEMEHNDLQPEMPKVSEQEHNPQPKSEPIVEKGHSPDGYASSPTQHWVDTSNNLNEDTPSHPTSTQNVDSSNYEYEYVYEDDPRSIVYGEILTPDWQNSFTNPSSNLQQAASSNEISAQAIAKELSAIEAKMITSQEISDDFISNETQDMVLDEKSTKEMN